MLVVMLSICIATFNRAEILRYPLESLCHQTASPQTYEILIIDNASTDHTRWVVQEFQNRFPTHQIRYLFEPDLSVSLARNRGWVEAKNLYIGYIDDDCKIPENWVETVLNIIDSYAPDAFGGPYFAFYTREKPGWYKDSYRSKGQEIQVLRPLKDGELLYGPNMIFRRDILKQVGGFNPDYGPRGYDFFYGEEADLLIRIRQQIPDVKLLFVPHLLVYHLVRPEKTQMRSILRDYFQLGRTLQRVYPPKKTMYVARIFLKFIYYSLKLFMQASYGIIFRDRKQYPYFQNYLYEKVFLNVLQLGHVVEQAKSRLAGWTVYEIARLHYHRYRLRHRIQNAAPLNVVLGAAETRFPGWISTDKHLLDITREADWERLFSPDSIDRLLMEHVLEHLDKTECQLALQFCYRYLKPSGRLRIAVPDGYREDAYYLNHVSPPADGHQQLFTIDSLTSLLTEIGFSVQALEYYDSNHQFHSYLWDEADGYIRRSARFDRRIEFERDNHFYTSLMVDAIK